MYPHSSIHNEEQCAAVHDGRFTLDPQGSNAFMFISASHICAAGFSVTIKNDLFFDTYELVLQTLQWLP